MRLVPLCGGMDGWVGDGGGGGELRGADSFEERDEGARRMYRMGETVRVVRLLTVKVGEAQ